MSTFVDDFLVWYNTTSRRMSAFGEGTLSGQRPCGVNFHSDGLKNTIP